jgi:biopolymer transport protein ExbD
MAGRVKKDLGQFEDPDLVPIMNMVCVIIPLILWTMTWVTFGQITVLRGTEGAQSKARMSEQMKKLRLVAVVTKSSITLMAGREVAAEVMPEDTATGLKGRIDIPHRAMTVLDIEKEQQTCQPPADPREFNDCAYWAYVVKMAKICWQNPQGQIKVPDLKRLNTTLRTIKDRVIQAFGDDLDDKDQINIKAEDDIPYCQIVGIMDFARLRQFDLDWTKNEAFMEGVSAAIEKGQNDPFLDPKTWNPEMKKELMFPIVGFVN